MKKIIVISLFILLVGICRLSAENKQVSFVIHVHSDYSYEGEHSIKEISVLAKEAGISAVFLSDTALMKWEYGLRPFQGLIKRKVEYRSVIKEGPKKYIKEIMSVNKENPGVLMIPGVEAAPFYYWTGSPYKLDITLNEWHKHMLVTGLSSPTEYLELPIIGNENNAGKIKLLSLWPFLLLVFSAFMLKIEKMWGKTFLVISLLLIINNAPFKNFSFSQYHSNEGEKPYQDLINYVNKISPINGITIWAHPEAPNYINPQKVGLIKIKTSIYPQALLNTQNYSGFSYFQEGWREVGKPGGLWDKVLLEYCEGKRKYPIWAFGELDFKKQGFLGTFIDSIVNICDFTGPEALTENNLIKLIKKGNFYVCARNRASYSLILSKYEITNDIISAGQGGMINSSVHKKVRIELRSSDQLRHKVKISLIMNGQLKKEINDILPCSLSYSLGGGAVKNYLRMEVAADNGARLITNPIFYN